MAITADSEQLHEGRPFDPYGAHRDDPYSFLADIGDAEPVFYAPLLDAWCVTRREDMVAVLRDDRSFSARDHNPRPAVELPEDVSRMFRTWRGAGAVAVGSLDPPEHARIREVLNAGFTPARVRAFEPTIRAIAADLVERAAVAPEFDFISAFAVPYALEVICRRLGIPDEYLARCRTWSEQRIELMMLRGDTDPDQLREHASGLMEFGAFARSLVRERLASPQDDLISELLHEGRAGNTLTADEVSVQVPTLIFAGHMTCAEALGTILFQQLRSPGGWAEVVDGTISTRDLVEEGLRFDSPLAGMYRTAVRDVAVGGVHLAQGSRLLLLYGAAGRDSRSHACPAAFSPGSRSATHLAFGHGIHFCLGAGFARAELEIAIQAVAARMPDLTLAPGLPPRHRPVFPLRALSELRVRQG
ncbi:cytochrome P450 [Streptomyces sp. WI04-05B]|uniref:cytochrome P450 n=1 Tax=Streptomyces TaxID=1883 RepID=UPI0029B3DA26|nr:MULTISPECIES: cytochrome P450 [unclassified Streptomyces]MDX2546564.1 cytochrome P450 [Streptomyces sp. WI04-05B]MDX2587804.1 cytochrome P450 [Streptomyces sp. WI04-05A]